MTTNVPAKIGLGLLSAGLLTCSLPQPDMGRLAWIALVPLLIASNGARPLTAAGVGFVSGFAAAFGIYNWLFAVPDFRWIQAVILAAYVAIYPTVWCIGISLSSRLRYSLTITAPALWVIMDYARANAGFLALPWGTLAQTQHNNLALLQFASIAGEHGVSYLVALGNTALAEIILQRAWNSALFAGLMIAAAHGGGAWALSQANNGLSFRIAAIQPNIQVGDRANAASRAASLDRLEELTRKAATSRPDLIVWPETAIPGNLQSSPQIVSRLQSLAQEIGIPIVLGAAEVEKFIPRKSEQATTPRAYNSAYLIVPGEPLTMPYRKRVLLPFGEYIPLRHLIRWPAWLTPDLTDLTPGNLAHPFRLKNGLEIGPLICWENLFAWLSRDSVQNGAHLLVQLTNDSWFGPTAAPWQHNLGSVVRAVENRVPIVVASNTGPSQIIDAYGRVVASVPQIFTEDIVTGEAALGTGGTVYTYSGDFFVFAVSGSLLFSVIRKLVLLHPLKWLRPIGLTKVFHLGRRA